MPEATNQPDDAALMQAYLEGALTLEEAARLHLRLLEKPPLAEALLAELRTDAMLREINAGAEIASPKITRVEFRLPLRVRWLLPLAGAAAVALCAAIWFLNERPAARLVSVSGELSLVRGAEALPARAGTGLRAGDVVRSQTGADAEIVFRGEATRLRMTDAAELALNQIAGGKSVELRWGRLDAEVAPQPAKHPLQLATRHAVTTVFGTRLTLAARANGTWLRLDRGTAQLRKIETDAADAVATVAAGQFAVAAPGVALAAHPAAAFEEMSAPLAVSLAAGMPTGFGEWLPAGDGVRQVEVARAPDERRRADGTFDRSKPNLYSFYYLPVATAGSFRLRATIDPGETTTDTREEGDLNLWRVGFGLRYPEHEIGLHLAVRNEPDRPRRAWLRTLCLIPEWNRFVSVPLANAPNARVTAGPGSSFRLLWEVRRAGKSTLHLRGKLWPADETEPAEWTVDTTTDAVEGPLGAVTFETFRAACTFRDFTAELLP